MGQVFNCHAYFQVLATIANSLKLSSIIELQKYEIR